MYLKFDKFQVLERLIPVKIFLAANGRNTMVGEENMYTSKRKKLWWKISCSGTETIYTAEIKKLIWSERMPDAPGRTSKSIEFFSSKTLYWMKPLFLMETSSWMDVLSPTSFFPILPGITTVIQAQTCSQKPIFECNSLLGSYTFFPDMDQ